MKTTAGGSYCLQVHKFLYLLVTLQLIKKVFYIEGKSYKVFGGFALKPQVRGGAIKPKVAVFRTVWVNTPDPQGRAGGCIWSRFRGTPGGYLLLTSPGRAGLVLTISKYILCVHRLRCPPTMTPGRALSGQGRRITGRALAGINLRRTKGSCGISRYMLYLPLRGRTPGKRKGREHASSALRSTGIGGRWPG